MMDDTTLKTLFGMAKTQLRRDREGGLANDLIPVSTMTGVFTRRMYSPPALAEFFGKLPSLPLGLRRAAFEAACMAGRMEYPDTVATPPHPIETPEDRAFIAGTTAGIFWLLDQLRENGDLRYRLEENTDAANEYFNERLKRLRRE